MKKAAAVLCELNPLHPGHCHVWQMAGMPDRVVLAVMSGSFTQRGIPAVYDKYKRAEAAVRNGADLVVEWPFPWCASGAESFAAGGVAIAAGCGADTLTFGSESGDVALLEQTAACKADPAYAERMQEAERTGRERGSAVLCEDVLRSFGIEPPAGANDKLGAEYIRFGRAMGLERFEPVRRMRNLPSASDIRAMLREAGLDGAGDYIRGTDVFRTAAYCPEERLDAVYFAYSRLAIALEGERAEENPLLRYAAKTARSVRTAAEFIERLPTKKYTLARMRRELLFSLLHITQEQLDTSPDFTVLLAANETGRAYLAENKDAFRLPIVTKPADISALSERAKEQYAVQKEADALYAYLLGQPADFFLKQHPAML